MQQHLGVTHISGRRLVNARPFNNIKKSRSSRHATFISHRSVPGRNKRRRLRLRVGARDSFCRWNAGLAPASVEDGKLFQTASWAAAQRCLCTLSRVPSPLGPNQPHHPSQISSSTTCGKQPTPHLTSQQAAVGHLLLAQEPPTDGWAGGFSTKEEACRLVSTHPTIITSFVRMMPFFFFLLPSSCRVGGGVTFRLAPPHPSSRQVTTPSSRWRHD